MRHKSHLLFDHYLDGVKDRIRLRIDGHTACIATAALKDQAEHLKLMNECQAATNASCLADLERQVRPSELQQRMEEIAVQRRQSQQLREFRLYKERLAISDWKSRRSVAISRTKTRVNLPN